MRTYNVSAALVLVIQASGALLTLKFGEQAQNTEIVPDAVGAIKVLALAGGSIVLLNGPASLPVAIAIGHELSHLYGAVACFDPKLNGYVVAVSHDPQWVVGSLIASDSVVPAEVNPIAE